MSKSFKYFAVAIALIAILAGCGKSNTDASSTALSTEVSAARVSEAGKTIHCGDGLVEATVDVAGEREVRFGGVYLKTREHIEEVQTSVLVTGKLPKSQVLRLLVVHTTTRIDHVEQEDQTGALPAVLDNGTFNVPLRTRDFTIYPSMGAVITGVTLCIGKTTS